MTDLDHLEPDHVVLAGEYALACIDGERLALAKRLFRTDQDFAAMVEWWDLHFNDLHDQFEDVAPPATLWRAIELKLTEQDNDTAGHTAGRELSGRIAAGFIGVILGALIMFTLVPQRGPEDPVLVEVPSAAAPQLVASLDDGQDGLVVTARLDPSSNSLAVRIAGVPAATLGPDRAPELWIVPDGAAPRSLGILPLDGSISRELNDEVASLFQSGALIAVTYEDRDSAPHEAPTTDIVAAGQLVEI